MAKKRLFKGKQSIAKNLNKAQYNVLKNAESIIFPLAKCLLLNDRLKYFKQGSNLHAKLSEYLGDSKISLNNNAVLFYN